MPPIDRTATLRNAEKLLRQGKLLPAIEEYGRVVEDQPRDWNTANMLGDLYVRAGQVDKAVEQFTRIADSLSDEGFLPKAGALYKKVLKLKDTLADGVIVQHTITAKSGEVDFRLIAHNPTRVRSEAHWAQPCVRLAAFTGFGSDSGGDLDDYLHWFHGTVVGLRDLLASHGAIFVHLDWHIEDDARVIMDEVLRENQQAELVEQTALSEARLTTRREPRGVGVGPRSV